MTDRTNDQSPDSRPRDDDRGSIEGVDRPETADPRNGAVGGTDGAVKNQGDDAQ